MREAHEMKVKLDHETDAQLHGPGPGAERQTPVPQRRHYRHETLPHLKDETVCLSWYVLTAAGFLRLTREKKKTRPVRFAALNNCACILELHSAGMERFESVPELGGVSDFKAHCMPACAAA